MRNHHDKVTTRIAVIAVCLVALLLFVVVTLILQPKGRLKCADFGSYSDALTAYNNGAKYLDGNHDGIPCNSLKK